MEGQGVRLTWKDIHRYWLLVLILCSVTVLAQYGRGISDGLEMPAVLVVPLYWAVLLLAFVPFIVLLDSPALPEAFWHTRPISPATLARAKLGLIMVFGVFLPACVELIFLMREGLSAKYAPPALLELLLDHMLPLFFVAVVAANCTTIYRYFGCLSAFVIFFFGLRGCSVITSSSFSPFDAGSLPAARDDHWRFLLSNLFLAMFSGYIFVRSYTTKSRGLNLLMLALAVIPFALIRYDWSFNLLSPFPSEDAATVTLAPAQARGKVWPKEKEVYVSVEGLPLPAGSAAELRSFRLDSESASVGYPSFLSGYARTCVRSQDLKSFLEKEMGTRDVSVWENGCERVEVFSRNEQALERMKTEELSGRFTIALFTLKPRFRLPLNAGEEWKEFPQIVSMQPLNLVFQPQVQLRDRIFDLALGPESTSSENEETPRSARNRKQLFVLFNGVAREAMIFPVAAYYSYGYEASRTTRKNLAALLGLERSRETDSTYTMRLFDNSGRSRVSAEWLEKAEVLGIEAIPQGIAEVSLAVSPK